MNFSPLAQRGRRALAAALLGASLLTACGGGTSQVNAFQPDRLLAFGDELSYMTSGGLKYTVNSLGTDNTVDCTLTPIWVQFLASHYNKVFSQCIGTVIGADASALQLAAVNARVDDVATQVSNYLSGAGFQSNDLVTVAVGMHDVLDQYALYDGTNEADLAAALTIKGQLLAQQVNTIVGTGAKVLVSTVPDMGLTPFAINEKNNVGDDRPGLLTRLTDDFNKSMRLALINDGSKIGLLLADDLSRAMVRVPAAYALTDVVTPICTTALPNCTTATVESAASGKTAAYLWADDLHPGTAFQQQLGNQAVSRVTTLPF